MAALEPEDPFNVSVIDELNELLRTRCPYLSFFYEKTTHTRGKYGRKIGFHYNKTIGDVVYKDVEVSCIDLDKNLSGEVTILYSSTVDIEGIIFNKRKLNSCLRLLSGMIASKEGVGISSSAVNPISLYTMIKYFDCTIQKEPGLNEDVSQCSTLEKCITFMEQYNSEEEHDFNGEAVRVLIKTDVPNYDVMLGKLKNLIQEINCVGLGGTRRKRKNKRTKRIDKNKNKM
jgi:hypothetical protein